MIIHDINPLILNKFGTDFVGRSRDEIIYICPYCEDNVGSPDGHGHLYVNNKNLLYYCQRCGAKGYVGKSIPDFEYDPVPSDSEMMGLLESVVGNSYEVHADKLFRIPMNLVNPESKCGRYLLNRGITSSIINFYSIRQGEGSRRDRVFVPNVVYHHLEGDLVYDDTDMFVARYCDDIPLNMRGKPAFPKYLNPPGADKSEIVFNLHRIEKGSPIIVCEGVFSAISAGRNAVAIYGKTISQSQLSLILSNEPSRIYVCLDPDARREAISLCYKLTRVASVPIFDIVMPTGHDPNSLGHNEFMDILVRTRQFDPVERQLMAMGYDLRNE